MLMQTWHLVSGLMLGQASRRSKANPVGLRTIAALMSVGETGSPCHPKKVVMSTLSRALLFECRDGIPGLPVSTFVNDIQAVCCKPWHCEFDDIILIGIASPSVGAFSGHRRCRQAVANKERAVYNAAVSRISGTVFDGPAAHRIFCC